MCLGLVAAACGGTTVTITRTPTGPAVPTSAATLPPGNSDDATISPGIDIPLPTETSVPRPTWAGRSVTGTASGYITGSFTGVLKPIDPTVDPEDLVIDVKVMTSSWDMSLSVTLSPWHGPDQYHLGADSARSYAILMGSEDTSTVVGFLTAPSTGGTVEVTAAGPSSFAIEFSAEGHSVTLQGVLKPAP